METAPFTKLWPIVQTMSSVEMAVHLMQVDEEHVRQAFLWVSEAMSPPIKHSESAPEASEGLKCTA